jgi:mono/diheme cytochrome c family protein
MAALIKRSKIFHIILFGAIFISGILISLFAFEEKEQYPFPEDPLRGSKLFVSKGCIKCHAIWGIGDALGPDLAQMSKEQNLLQLAGLLWSHSPKMIEIMQERGVSRPTFTPQEMGDLMGYIYYFNYFDQPGSFVEGERLFDEKGCARCHFVGQDGGKYKMSLDDYGKYISPSFLVTGLWNHSVEILSEMKKIGIKQPEFKGRELTHMLAYIRGAADNPNGEIVYAEPGSPKRGEGIFKQKNCNVCHAVWGEGGKKGSDLGRRELRLSLTEISGKIWSHSSQMWQEMKKIGLAFPIFLPEEMADLISYLYFIQFYDDKGDSREGKRLFREKVCIFCHALEGEGENVGPDLSESEAQFSPIIIATAMWNHAIVMEDMLAEKDLAWPRFSGNEMRDLVSYVQDASTRSKVEKEKRGIVPSKSKVLFLSENRFDLDVARQGKKIYTAKACQACHNITGKKRAMGGDLKNITKIRDLEWLFSFIKNPKSMLKTDGLAKQLLREFNNIPMPQQGLSDEEVIAIIEYLKAPEKIK